MSNAIFLITLAFPVFCLPLTNKNHLNKKISLYSDQFGIFEPWANGQAV